MSHLLAATCLLFFLSFSTVAQAGIKDGCVLAFRIVAAQLGLVRFKERLLTPEDSEKVAALSKEKVPSGELLIPPSKVVVKSVAQGEKVLNEYIKQFGTQDWTPALGQFT